MPASCSFSGEKSASSAKNLRHISAYFGSAWLLSRSKALCKRTPSSTSIYIGCSAGAAIAGVSVEEIKDFDKNNVGMTDFSGLGLFDGIIIPHYTKKELKRYISNSYGIEDKYKSILSVSNEKSLVMEVS